MDNKRVIKDARISSLTEINGWIYITLKCGSEVCKGDGLWLSCKTMIPVSLELQTKITGEFKKHLHLRKS